MDVPSSRIVAMPSAHSTGKTRRWSPARDSSDSYGMRVHGMRTNAAVSRGHQFLASVHQRQPLSNGQDALQAEFEDIAIITGWASKREAEEFGGDGYETGRQTTLRHEGFGSRFRDFLDAPRAFLSDRDQCSCASATAFVFLVVGWQGSREHLDDYQPSATETPV